RGRGSSASTEDPSGGEFSSMAAKIRESSAPEDVASDLLRALRERKGGSKQTAEIERKVAEVLAQEREKLKKDLRAEIAAAGSAGDDAAVLRDRIQKLDSMMAATITENQRLADTVTQLQSRNEINEMRLEEISKSPNITPTLAPPTSISSGSEATLLTSIYPQLQKSTIFPRGLLTGEMNTATGGPSEIARREKVLEDMSLNATRLSAIAAREEETARNQEYQAARLAAAREQRLRAEFLTDLVDDDVDAQYIQAQRRFSAFSSADLESPLKAQQRSRKNSALYSSNVSGAGAGDGSSKTGDSSSTIFLQRAVAHHSPSSSRIYANPTRQGQQQQMVGDSTTALGASSATLLETHNHVDRTVLGQPPSADQTPQGVQQGVAGGAVTNTNTRLDATELQDGLNAT
ncbi:unnamed protein product, partial [Amoebophrya sp. A25]